MNIIIGYGAVLLFFALIVYVLERSKSSGTDTFTDYAVAGRSFGSWFQTMAFLNTWLPGTVFIAFAGLAAGAGVIGFYIASYSLLTVLFMFFIAQKVFEWGRHFDLRTQADFVGMRYNSTPVRVVSAVIGVVSLFPWLVLGLQSVGIVFSYLSFGMVSPTQAVFVGIAVLAVRQIWTVRMGMRGIVISDMVQGIMAYGVGGLIALGFIVWLVGNGHGFGEIPASFATLPGVGSELGPLYFMSLVFTGALGALCWPDIFVRLFTGRSTKTIKRSARQASVLLFVFITILLVMAMLASSVPGVAEGPDNVWFITAATGGPFVLALAGVAVLAATMGNVNAITAAMGTHTAQDIIHVQGASDEQTTRTAKTATIVVTVLAVIGALITVNWTSGLFMLAVVSYQGIVQLAPSLYFGIFWKRGNAAGAVVGMLVGFAVAVVLQLVYPVSIKELWGLTSGMVGMLVNAAIYIAFAYLAPVDAAERARVACLFDDLGNSPTIEADSKLRPEVA